MMKDHAAKRQQPSPCQPQEPALKALKGKRRIITVTVLVIIAAMLSLSLFGCGGSSQKDSTSSNATQSSTATSPSGSSSSAAASGTSASQPSSTTDNSWRLFLTNYENWIDNSYVPFMKKYKDNPSDPTLATDAIQILADAQEWLDRSSEWDANSLSVSDYKEYSDTLLRIAQKIADASPW